MPSALYGSRFKKHFSDLQQTTHTNAERQGFSRNSAFFFPFKSASLSAVGDRRDLNKLSLRYAHVFEIVSVAL
jgi:hypothetical protein